jgi:alpha-L-fucosidase
VNEGFEEVFEEFESERKNPIYFDDEISAVIKEAIDPMMKNRTYRLQKNDSLSKVTPTNEAS